MALVYRALERNTGSVGLASAACKSLKAVNPEIAAIQQHQDPAGDGAQALNKQIAQELARQIASVGGDPTMANEASTFAPGKIGDPTAAGNTCDDAKDDKGCINTQGLRVDDLTAAEITAAVAGSNGTVANGAAANGTAADGAGANGNASNNNGNKKNGNKKNNGNKNNSNNNGAANNAADQSAAAGSCATTGNAAAAGNAAASGKDAAAAKDNAATGNGTAGAAASTGAADFGNCDPTVRFGLPSDGRKENAFEPTDLKTFNHGSALKIAVISDFICSQLPNKCNANAAAESACKAASTAAGGLDGQAAADAFNSALGF